MRWVSPNFHSVLECCRSWQNNLIAPDVQIFLCPVPEIDGHFAVAICNLATSRRRQRIVKKRDLSISEVALACGFSN
jgi:hypothetical protein